MATRIEELAVPKGITVPPCEICGNKSITKCEKCRVTFYCSENHKQLDFKAFHGTVCELLGEIRMELPAAFSESERIEEKNKLIEKKKNLIARAESNARKWILEGDFELAYAPALIAQNMAEDLWSKDSMDFIYPTCLVSEVFLGLRNSKVAEDYMIIASWTSQKHDIVPTTILSRLYRLKGLVYMALGNWKEAKIAFAEFVYAVSFEHGISDIRIAVAYGYLGLSLLRCGDTEGAMASFHKMADKWMEWLLDQYENKTMRVATESKIRNDNNVREMEFQFMESKIAFQLLYESIRNLGMDAKTDYINFKILCVQCLSYMRSNKPRDAVVFREEALAAATRTKMEKAVRKCRFKMLVEVLGDDYLMRWERKHNRPRTCATKYLEMIKAIKV